MKPKYKSQIEKDEKDRKLIEEGEILAREAIPRLRDPNDVNALVNLRKDYRDARLKRIPGAQGIILMKTGNLY